MSDFSITGKCKQCGSVVSVDDGGCDCQPDTEEPCCNKDCQQWSSEDPCVECLVAVDFNKQKRRVTLVNGSTYLFKGSSDKDDFQSYQTDFFMEMNDHDNNIND